MVRHRFHMIVTLGRFNDALKWVRAMNDDAKKNGWPESRMMSPGFGPVNQLIVEMEYADLAMLDKQQNEFNANAEAMATFRSGIDLNAAGTHPWDEVEISVEQDIA
jgi:hypothetical protein